MSLVELSWRIAMVLDRIGVNTRARAQSTVEYALVGALVVIAAAGALTVLGTELSAVFANISNTLRGAAAAR